MAKVAKLEIEIKRSKAFDELVENCSDIVELLDMIPDYRSEEANVIAQRIVDRQNGWVTVSNV